MKLITTILAAILLSGCTAAKSQYYPPYRELPRESYQEPPRESYRGSYREPPREQVIDYRPLHFIYLYNYMHTNINKQMNDGMKKHMLNHIDKAGMEYVCEHNNCFIIYNGKKIIIKKEYIEITVGGHPRQIKDIIEATMYIYN